MKALSAIGALFIASCSSQSQFQTLYDYYFPPRGEYLSTEYRRYYDKTMFGAPPREHSLRPADQKLYYALRGDAKAFHEFMHDSDRGTAGEFGETWYFDCLLLLLRLGDDRFSDLLHLEDQATREAAGAVIDSHIKWSKHQFPKTRALYHFRWGPRESPTPNHAMQRTATRSIPTFSMVKPPPPRFALAPGSRR
jgi:hypothetical protein